MLSLKEYGQDMVVIFSMLLFGMILEEFEKDLIQYHFSFDSSEC
jgi:hypothetical protein